MFLTVELQQRRCKKKIVTLTIKFMFQIFMGTVLYMGKF